MLPRSVRRYTILSAIAALMLTAGAAPAAGPPAKPGAKGAAPAAAADDKEPLFPRPVGRRRCD